MCCHRFTISDANALRISDCEIPNCRAILEGVMPALKAARMAFSFAYGSIRLLLPLVSLKGNAPED
jgi:hypothetical protein